MSWQSGARCAPRTGVKSARTSPTTLAALSRNPGRDFFDKKFNIVTRGISSEKREELRATWWDIEKVTDIAEPIKTLDGIRQL